MPGSPAIAATGCGPSRVATMPAAMMPSPCMASSLGLACVLAVRLGCERFRLCWLRLSLVARCRLTNLGLAAVLPSALPGVAFVPYAEAVPDGGRRGFEAAVTVRAPIV